MYRVDHDGEGEEATKEGGGVITRVVKVNGLDPNVWQGNPQHVYVGRKVVLRSGAYQGAVWTNLGFANEYKFDADDADKRAKLFAYVQGLKVSLERSPVLRKRFSMLAGKTLGCWCVNWDGKGVRPNCHAAWLAGIVDAFARGVGDRQPSGVLVNIFGAIMPVEIATHQDTDKVCVIRRTW
jgi:hypothetical protein